MQQMQKADKIFRTTKKWSHDKGGCSNSHYVPTLKGRGTFWGADPVYVHMGVSNGAGIDTTLVCKISCELVGDKAQIYMEISLGHDEYLFRVYDLALIFKIT